VLLTGEVGCKESIKLAGQKGLTAVRHDWILVPAKSSKQMSPCAAGIVL